MRPLSVAARPPPPPQEHECLIDFIAVSPEARGRGVGARLMAWAESAGAAILADTEAEAVAAQGVDMTLWVAADNGAALRLYQRAGYAVVRRTDGGACHCMASRVLQRFLGHPGAGLMKGWCLGAAWRDRRVGAVHQGCKWVSVTFTDHPRCLPSCLAAVWVKMRKPLPPPPHLASRKPEQLSIQLVASAGPALPTAAAAAEGGLEEVPLGAAPAPPVQQPDKAAVGCAGGWLSPGRQPRPAGDGEVQPVPDSPARRLLHKLSHGLFAPSGEALPPHGSPRTASAPSCSQGPTPRIAAVGVAAPTGFGPAAPEPEHASEAACLQTSTYKEGGSYAQLAVQAAPSTGTSASASDNKRSRAPSASAQPGPASLASVSVGSMPSVAGDSDSEGDIYRAAYQRTGIDARAPGPDVFEVVELSSCSATYPAVVGA